MKILAWNNSERKIFVFEEHNSIEYSSLSQSFKLSIVIEKDISKRGGT